MYLDSHGLFINKYKKKKGFPTGVLRDVRYLDGEIMQITNMLPTNSRPQMSLLWDNVEKEKTH